MELGQECGAGERTLRDLANITPLPALQFDIHRAIIVTGLTTIERAGLHHDELTDDDARLASA
jgi:hypothetical protein